MKRPKKIALWGAGILVLFLGLLAIAPGMIRAYIERTYSFVKVGRVELGWPIRLYDVRIQKDTIQADLREVRATPRKKDPIQIFGGTVHVIRRKKGEEPGKETEGRTIIARDLKVTVEAEELRAELEGASINGEYRFKTGVVTYKNFTAKLTDGQASRNLREVTVSSAEVEVTLPFDLPRVPKKGLLQISGLSANIPDRKAELQEISFGPVKARNVHLHQVEKSFQGTVKTVVIDHPWVAVEPASFQDVEFTIPRPISEMTFSIGRAKFQTEPAKYRISGDNSCGDWLSALPEPRPEALRVPSENFKGTLRFDVQAKPIPKFDLKFDCKYTCSAEPIKSLRSSKFTYMAYNSKGELFERTVGRNIAGWTDLANLPENVTKAFITLEDPGFLSHRGIIVQALQNSFVDNLKLGKFFRGGSTITMQLAKNLWLKRHKTVSRKVYEALLAIALESCLSKEEILELYLNVVEFGPDLYGIGPAAKRYFDKEVGDLSPEEGFYLAALLPNPKKAIPPNQGGLDNAKKLMKALVNSGFLPDAYLPQTDSDTTDWLMSDG